MNQDEFMLAHIFEEHRTGHTFDRWPIHITLVPWFLLNNNSKDGVLDVLTEITKEHLPIAVNIGKHVMLGPQKDKAAFLIESSDFQLENYHKKLVQALGEIGCKILDETYTDENYMPHTTTNAPPPLVRAQVIKDVALVKKLSSEKYVAGLLTP